MFGRRHGVFRLDLEERDIHFTIIHLQRKLDHDFTALRNKGVVHITGNGENAGHQHFLLLHSLLPFQIQTRTVKNLRPGLNNNPSLELVTGSGKEIKN